MVQLLALVWRKLLRKRWVLGVVFGLSLIYFLSSTFKQVSGPLADPLQFPSLLTFLRIGVINVSNTSAGAQLGPPNMDY